MILANLIWFFDYHKISQFQTYMKGGNWVLRDC